MLLLDDSSFKEYCEIPIPKRKYSSKEERVDDETARDELRKQFFEDKSYPHPKELLAYTDFSEFSNPKFEAEIEDQELAPV